VIRLEGPFNRNGKQEWKVVRSPGAVFGAEAFIAPGPLRAILYFLRCRGRLPGYSRRGR
jgi:hypothetical protein